MASNVLASWDFRGADSAATKRIARIGGYTLTESGTPTWSTNGVDCSGAAGDKLKLTLTAELKVSPAWIICSMELMEGTAPADYTTIFGIQRNTAGEYETTLTAYRGASANMQLRAYIGAAYDGVGTATSPTTGNETVIALRRTGTNNPAIGIRVKNEAWVSGLNSSDPLDYTSTSFLLLGSDGTQNSKMRFNWLMMGDGAISDAEVQAIYDNPTAFLYPAAAVRRKRVLTSPRKRAYTPFGSTRFTMASTQVYVPPIVEPDAAGSGFGRRRIAAYVSRAALPPTIHRS